MGRKLILKAGDGHQLGAYRADAAGMPKGRVVVIQEIFGVNKHIRNVCDRLAAAGYTCIAPQIFDRMQRDFESGYSQPEIDHAMGYIGKLDWVKVMVDIEAAINSLKGEGPVAIMGFCLGGTLSFIASTRFNGLAGAVCYYGGAIAKYADNKPRCPVLMHFGERDSHIPMSDVNLIRQKQPQAEIHVYGGAGHGFNCDERGSFEPQSQQIAWERTLKFLATVFGKQAELMSEPLKAGAAAMPGMKSGKVKTSKKDVKAAKKARKKTAKSAHMKEKKRVQKLRRRKLKVKRRTKARRAGRKK
jgi:carboxymethylenebutenolidase